MTELTDKPSTGGEPLRSSPYAMLREALLRTPEAEVMAARLEEQPSGIGRAYALLESLRRASDLKDAAEYSRQYLRSLLVLNPQAWDSIKSDWRALGENELARPPLPPASFLNPEMLLARDDAMLVTCAFWHAARNPARSEIGPWTSQTPDGLDLSFSTGPRLSEEEWLKLVCETLVRRATRLTAELEKSPVLASYYHFRYGVLLMFLDDVGASSEADRFFESFMAPIRAGFNGQKDAAKIELPPAEVALKVAQIDECLPQMLEKLSSSRKELFYSSQLKEVLSALKNVLARDVKAIDIVNALGYRTPTEEVMNSMEARLNRVRFNDESSYWNHLMTRDGLISRLGKELLLAQSGRVGAEVPEVIVSAALVQVFEGVVLDRHALKALHGVFQSKAEAVFGKKA